jgi:hypothetical protein
LLYGVLPLTIILYLLGSSRRRRRAYAEKMAATAVHGQPEPKSEPESEQIPKT